MTMRFRCDGTTGRTAIYDTSNGDAPFTDPLSNVSLLRFHSDLWSPAVDMHTPVSLTFPFRQLEDLTTYDHVIFAHGKSGIPLIKGYVVIDGVHVPLTGSIPIQTTAVGFGRILSVGADATNVFVTELVMAQYTSVASVTLPFSVYVTDVLLDTEETRPNESVAYYQSPTLFKAGRGRISTAKRYLRATSTAPDFHFPTGQTVNIENKTTRYTKSPLWRYSVNGYVQEQTRGDDNIGHAAQSFNADIQGVRT